MRFVQNKGFTLMELIFAIVIVIILATISFFNFGTYNSSARDSSRIADITILNQSIALFFTQKNLYPPPSNKIDVSYSGSVIWSQGTIGDSVITNLGSIAKKPIDPLTNDEYTYSLAANGVEYQLATALEKEKDNDPTASFFQKANAATGDAFAKVLGNYNGIVIFANTGGIDYGLAVPSLISGDLSTREIATTIARKKLSYNTFSAVPSKLAHAYTSGNFDFSPTNIVAWTGSISELRKGKGYKTLADNLAYIYGSSILNAYGAYQNLQSNTEKAINKNGSKKFKVFASCDNLATTGKVSEDGMYTIKPSDGVYKDLYCDLKSSTGNPFPTASLSVDFTTGKAFVNSVKTPLSDLFTVSRSSVATYESANGIVTSIPADTLRYGDKGLLVEDARTNVIPDATNFTSGSPYWSLSQATVTANTLIAPDGTATADTLVFGAGSSVRRLTAFNPPNTSFGQTYTFSFYVKGTAGDHVQPYIYDGGTGTFYWPTYTLTGNWQRVWVTGIKTSNSDYRVGIFNDNGTVTTGTVYLWGAQLEQGNYPTSYIPTSGASVTRARDAISLTGGNFTSWYNALRGTLYVEGSTISNGNSRTIVAINSNSADNNFSYRFMARTADIQLASHNVGAGGNQYAEYINPSNLGTSAVNFRIAMGALNNNFAGAINGSSPITDTSGTIVTANRLDIGSIGGAYFMDTAFIKTLSFWNTRKPNTEIKALSTFP